MKKMIDEYERDIAAIEQLIETLKEEKMQNSDERLIKRIELLREERLELIASVRAMEHYLLCIGEER